MKLPETPSQGREKCEECGGRNTEIINNSSLRNKIEYKCHDCNREFVGYNGPECPDCDSQNTRKQTRGVTPHRRSIIICYNCGRNRQ